MSNYEELLIRHIIPYKAASCLSLWDYFLSLHWLYATTVLDVVKVPDKYRARNHERSLGNGVALNTGEPLLFWGWTKGQLACISVSDILQVKLMCWDHFQPN